MQVYAYDHGRDEELRYTVIYSVGKEWSYLISSEDGTHYIAGSVTTKKPRPRPGARLIGYAALPYPVSKLVAGDIKRRIVGSVG